MKAGFAALRAGALGSRGAGPDRPVPLAAMLPSPWHRLHCTPRFFFSSVAADLALGLGPDSERSGGKRNFFASNAFMAFARSFNMFYFQLQIGINLLIMAYVGRLRLSGLKSELVKDRYVVPCTVTMSSPKRKPKQKLKHQKQTKHRTQKHKTTQTKQQPTQTKQQRDRFQQFMGEMGELMQEVITLYHLSMVWQSNKPKKHPDHQAIPASE